LTNPATGPAFTPASERKYSSFHVVELISCYAYARSDHITLYVALSMLQSKSLMEGH
jgi:hypothetical protein